MVALGFEVMKQQVKHAKWFRSQEFFLLSFLMTAALASGAEPKVKFNRDIRPIMSDTCFRCHGPDEKARMAGLRLDIREEALKTTKSGVTPIVPGEPDKSAIVERVFSTNPAKLMPPKYAHKELTEEQKNTIRRWVEEGAEYEGHWAYQPVRRPPVPKMEGKQPVRNPIDAFIQDRLAKEGLRPSEEADRRTLLRRVTLDLTGIPPTPEEMDAFLKDSSPQAFERVVDRLLASPRYAETQALHWLDAVRYADSSGFHGDNLWPAWPYRDYVLRAFRDNKPFDQFTREQLAGDLIPNATREQKVASAYNRMNRTSAEGGLQPLEYLAKYGADRVRTTSTVWLGATLGCAECHDHKFDPFSSKDFYAMKAFFADIRETGLVPDRGEKAWGSKLMLPTEEQSSRLGKLDEEIEAAELALEEKTETLKERRWEWEAEMLAAHKAGAIAWRYQRPFSAESVNGADLTIYNDEEIDMNYYLNGSLASERARGEGLVVASGLNPDNETYVVKFRPGQGTWTALGIDVFQDDSLPGNRLARGADRFLLTEVEAEVSSGTAPPEKLKFVLATSHGFGEPPGRPAMLAIDGDETSGWSVRYGEARNPFLALRLEKKLETSPDSVVTVRLRHGADPRRATIGRFRLALSSAEHSWPELGDSSRKAEAKKDGTGTLTTAVDLGIPPDVLEALEAYEADRNEDEQKLVEKHFAWAAPEFNELTIRLERLQAERAQLEAAIPRVVYTERQRPRITRVLPRANWMDDSGEIVEPAIPEFLGSLKTGGERATRLDLANWIVSPENPLTARVFVNRTWRHFFGTGLSKVLADLGSQGEWPTHPELLDWLASEFMEPSVDAADAHPWDVKHIVRTIVTSHTYRQSSLSDAKLDEQDPDNRLLARQSRYRVNAESVHDIALAVSGLLIEKFGGPSVRPYQPDGYLAAMNFPKREYSESRGEDLYRRAIYTEWRRTFLHPALETFDAPTREECAVNRVNSNTPLQALILLNDPIFVEASRVFAQHILNSGAEKFQGQLEWAFRRALNRTPEKAERQILADLHTKSLKRFQADEPHATRFVKVGETPLPANANAPELAAMTTVARAILNLHETITRN
ncbi:MAG: PSD1 and planctomycete cytochrome C domain-containing protein [Bryobacteraceae bacterium]